METFTASQSIQAVRAQERLPVHKVEIQAIADPSVLKLQDNPRQGGISTSTMQQTMATCKPVAYVALQSH